MDRINILKFLMISLALPAQYLITNYWSNDSVQQSIAINNMISQFYDFRSNYLSLESWKNWYVNLVMNDGLIIRRAKNREQQSRDGQKGATNVVYEYDDELAIEVLKYRKALVDFGESSVTRAPRPSRVQFRVGQVVRHKQLDLVGVIIGWDERAQAPISWIQRNYVDEDERDRFVQQPHYLILVDEKFQAKYSGKAYVVQDDIEVVQNNQIKHRTLRSYFSDFDGQQYAKKKYLNTVYPHD